MRLLLDTHIFLWFISADRRLKTSHQAAIVDPANEVFLSVASNWELVIKSQSGKLPLPQPADQYLRQQRVQHQIQSLPIDEGAMASLMTLPKIHGDPFDRIIVAQSIQHALTLVTDDPAIKLYPATFL